MAASQNKFDQAVWAVVANISSGCVMSYGGVARAAGYPRHARMVSKAMGRSTKPLPWYRVIKADDTLAFEPGSASYKKQRGLLEAEGVQFVQGKVIPVESDEAKDLDELLWGPSTD